MACMNQTINNRPINGSFIFYTTLLLAAGATVFWWAESQNPLKTIMAGGIVAMLLLMALIKALGPATEGAAWGFIALVFVSCVPISSLLAMHYNLPLSGKEIADMSLSGCTKDEVTSRIQTRGPVSRTDIQEITKLCEAMAKMQTPQYKAERLLEQQKRKALADAQLESL